MDQTGTLVIRTFISRAQIPVSDAIIVLSTSEKDGRQKLVSILRTNESGVAGPISLPAPGVSASITPGQNASAFSSYSLLAEHPDYQLAQFENIQIFPGVETVQDIALIPLSANGKQESDLTTVTPQPL